METTNKAVETKAVAAKKSATKKSVAKKEAKTMKKEVTTKKEVKAIENKDVQVAITIKDIEDAYTKAGIATKSVKGNYRVMGIAKKGGSSLNLHKNGDMFIFSTDEDAKAVFEAGIEGVEVKMGDNSQDKTRPNTVTLHGMETLYKVLEVYARNPMNVIPKPVEE